MVSEDVGVTLRLYLARAALIRAERLRDDSSLLARLGLLVLADRAVELLLLALLAKPPPYPKQELSGMIGELCARSPRFESHADAIVRIHSLRFRAEHDGIIPSHAETRRVLVDAKRFAVAAANEIGGAARDLQGTVRRTRRHKTR